MEIKFGRTFGDHWKIIEDYLWYDGDAPYRVWPLRDYYIDRTWGDKVIIVGQDREDYSKLSHIIQY